MCGLVYLVALHKLEEIMPKNEFYQLFILELRALYSAETQLLKALPKMAQAASNGDLKQAFLNHLEETKNQVDRLSTIFSSLNESPRGAECEAMKGLIKEGEEIMNSNFSPLVKDAALIAAAQRVEHYEIAGYGAVKTFAKHLELSEAESLLKETLEEEGNANKKLISIAEGSFFTNGINALAMKR